MFEMLKLKYCETIFTFRDDKYEPTNEPFLAKTFETLYTSRTLGSIRSIVSACAEKAGIRETQ
jgi:hypothetical protein